MSNKNIDQIWNAAKTVMESQDKIQYIADVNLSMPVGKSQAEVKTTLELVYEVDSLNKKAYIVAHKITGQHTETSELYYGNYASYVKCGNKWKKSPMPVDEFQALFTKGGGFNLSGPESFATEGMSLGKGTGDAFEITSTKHPVKFSKALLGRVNAFGDYAQKVDTGSVNIRINKNTHFVEKITIEADGKFEENKRSQNFKEKSVVRIIQLPDHFQIKLPEAVEEATPGMESLHLQDPTVMLSACSCTGCAACTACLACLACISCLFPPLAPPAAATAIASAIAAAVSISAGVARAAQAA